MIYTEQGRSSGFASSRHFAFPASNPPVVHKITLRIYSNGIAWDSHPSSLFILLAKHTKRNLIPSFAQKQDNHIFGILNWASVYGSIIVDVSHRVKQFLIGGKTEENRYLLKKTPYVSGFVPQQLKPDFLCYNRKKY